MDAPSQARGQPLALTRTMGDDNSLDECSRAEARVLNLDRTPWHLTEVEELAYGHSPLVFQTRSSNREARVLNLDRTP